ncbi:GH36-type glycosyl hydrolase domain-containing protein [Pseudoxanthomonas dokdonensis]|nr:glucoamylase family protein [Pseudoxanthomonas dokdonensis]
MRKAPALEAPLRATLLSSEQMEDRGRALARAHTIAARPCPDQLLGRLKENEVLLDSACSLLTSLVRQDLRIAPAGEWLLDNFYLVEEQIRTARRYLPKHYSRELPCLDSGPFAGLPRVYDLAQEVIAHGDGRIDAQSISRFVSAYQDVSPLRLGELWAIPIMLRLALIDNLRRVASRVMRDAGEQRSAMEWARALNRAALDSPRDMVLVVADMARSNPPLSGTFVAELTRNLQGGGAVLSMPLAWVEHWVTESGHSIKDLVYAENQQQAADQVSISNSIHSMRFLANMDWREFVETMSQVDAELRQDPAGTYSLMDFNTRDVYRHMVEKLAKRSGVAEPEVAALARQLAGQHRSDPLHAHVGYYLIDDGLKQLKQAVAAASPQGRVAHTSPQRLPLWAYLTPIAMLTVAASAILLAQLAGLGWPLWAFALAALLSVVTFSELAIALVNWLATILVTPRPLPRLDYSKGIPAQSRSLVAVPCMLGSTDGIDALVEGLEVRYLANRDAHLHFALLSDFLDASEETMPGDDALLDYASRQIANLNTRYDPEHGQRFFLLHRPRRWNPRERAWMGHERKRGKLAALNALLRQHRQRNAAAGDDFMRVVGNTEVLANVRYVITLDSDTRLPRDAAREFVGTLAHPLNHARFDETRNVVTRGYGILQPGIGSSMSGGRLTRFARLFGSEPGIDPYTRTVSDVYQDLFREGSFIGKGIYDVDAFEHALDNRFPENAILSHDLLEGCYARAGLVSDVRLFEDYPSRYATDVKRRSRWIRGDWQLLPWLLPWVPMAGNGWQANPLSWLSRGKLLDNLRRSLVPSATLILLLAGWLVLPHPLTWTLWLLSLLLLPAIVPALRNTFVKPEDMTLETHLLQVGKAVARQLQQALINLACLPYEALFSAAAITRTLWRLLVSRRHLLQWDPSSEVERRLGQRGNIELVGMLPSALLAVLALVAVAHFNPQALAVAAPLTLAWMLAPWLMAWLGQPPQARTADLSEQQTAFLGRLARRTWAFFEVYLRDEDHWLPPDNIQEHPSLVVARRTSPTNIGLSLLANLSAYDFGYLQVDGVMQRTSATLATMEALPRHRGHFYNWYDTETLAPLPPRYISTVDSGNLAGHLLTLRQGLLALVDAPVLAASTMTGLAHACGLLRETVHNSDWLDQTMRQALEAIAARIDDAAVQPPQTLGQALAVLSAIELQCARLQESFPPSLLHDDASSPHYWLRALREQAQHALREIRHLAPWLEDTATDAAAESVAESRIPSLRQIKDLAGHPLARTRARERIHQLERLAHLAGQMSLMEYGFLYDRGRKLLSIGYNVDERRLDEAHYDLLASEARLCSFVAIAQGQLPQDTWFALGRLLTEVNGDATLLSWSGSMFEYLMPQLVMPSYPDTLLDQTSQHAVEAQIAHGERQGIPWGVSESGYNTVDSRLNYQYRAFGTPGLGLKRGLSQDVVIAPYATMMALMVAPRAACENLQRLHTLGFSGRYGMYEAVDYTPARVPPGQEYALIRSFMAHHQGMGFLALDYLLCQQPMQKRFTADAEFQATLLLLQERIPHTGVFHPHETEAQAPNLAQNESEMQLRVMRSPSPSRPAVQLLSNGRYHGMLTSAGGGYSRIHEMALTRWREDSTRDPWGIWCYLRDVYSGDSWSAAYQPTCVDTDEYEAIFTDAKAEFRCKNRAFDSHLEIAISPEDDIELRRLRISNRSRRTRVIEITTYAEVVLAPAIADELHPAFSNLFVQTEIVAAKQALMCTRRPRSHDEVPPWMFHLVAVHDADVQSMSYETDRARFLGRGRTPRNPLALDELEALSNTSGSVLDPIVAIRTRIELKPEQTATIDMVYGTGPDRAACSALVDKYRDRRLADRVFDLAWTHSQVIRRQINASQTDAQIYEQLASLMLYTHPSMRADSEILLQNRRGQSGLWGHAISGDLPILLLQISDAENIELVRQLVQAHAYWRLKGLRVDLVIWNESQTGYRQQLQDQILGMIATDPEATLLDRPGGIFVRPAQQLTQEDRILLSTVARAIISDKQGSLASQVGKRLAPERDLPPLLEVAETPRISVADNVDTVDAGSAPAEDPLLGLPPAVALGEDQDPWPFEPVETQQLFDNGIGAFAASGREYIAVSRPGQPTPAPWSNILANPMLGSVVSESSTGYTWFENAHELRLTPWHNDPVSDTSGEAFYLRDEETGKVWSPLPLPCPGSGAYRTRHGFGYSVYEHIEDGIASELWVYVGLEDPVKYSALRLRNHSGRARRISATGYVEWVLGDLRAKNQMHVLTECDSQTGLLTARNPYNIEFEGRTAFFDVDAGSRSFTCDRAEFIGRNGSLAQPAALRRQKLSGRCGVAMDPCAAIQVPLELAADNGQRCHELVFRLGMATNAGEAQRLALRSRGVQLAHDALDSVRIHWLHVLGKIKVSTPEPSVDMLVNGWLMYQTLACRYIARSGYYQSGGAFGFRDQLQDTMASVHAAPELTREHLLASAAHQFPQGDVMHWWHPPQGRGVRTRCSDDYLWLPLATSRYLQVTADRSVLGESVRFVEGRPVNADEESYYDMPTTSHQQATLYRHCVLALQRGTELLGQQGLPLMGSGDWNDGMNRVGDAGKGESVWLGFFLYQTLTQFIAVAEAQGDAEVADYCRSSAATLRDNLHQHAWDGEWYRRAWFDDGTPVGSHLSDECRIDSISQSWAVLSGAGDPQRVRTAMASLDKYLVKRDAGLIQLLDPPFDKTPKDPGYIRGYVPGVRENGGQYTHAAVWTAMAFAEMGDSATAWELTRMINPVNHGDDADRLATYKVEPYVMAADVYGVAPHVGRGGWTWYTGSAGWMYRLLTESLLGLERIGDRLRVRPRVPAAWRDGYQLQYRHGQAVYLIELRPGDHATQQVWVDEQASADGDIPLLDDGHVHHVRIEYPAVD